MRESTTVAVGELGLKGLLGSSKEVLTPRMLLSLSAAVSDLAAGVEGPDRVPDMLAL
jgi:hypothetical protein